MKRPMVEPYFSVVLPVYNEAGNLRELHRRLTAVLQKLERSYEVVFVDDGSDDDSFAVLQQLAGEDPRLRALAFSRNFGHHIAITAGLDEARGEAIVLMDSDLQDQPEGIPVLHAKFLEGYDVVYGLRRNKRHSLFKRLTARIFLLAVNGMRSGGHEIHSDLFRVASREVVQAVRGCREQARFIAGLFSWVGFRQTGVEVPHGARHSGRTKYSLFKMIGLALDTFTGFSRLPLRLATWLGLAVSCGSFIYGVWLVVKKFWLDTAALGWTSTMVVLLFLGGIQLLALGLLGEYVGRIYVESQARPLYIVARRLGESDGESN